MTEGPPLRKSFTIIGHRGAMAVHPENSLEGFRYLLKNGIGWAETDLRLNRHGRIVLHHDFVSHQLVPIRFTGETPHILSLRNLLEELPSLNLNLEIKSPGVLEKLATIPHLHKTPERFIFSSFHHSLIGKLKKMYPMIPCLILVEGAFRNLCAYMNESGADGLVFQHEFYDADEIIAVVDSGKMVFSYSVDLIEEALQFKQMGLSGIISNNPVKIRDALRLAGFSSPLHFP